MAPQTTAGFSLIRGAPLMLIAALLVLAPTIEGRKLMQSSAYTPLTCDVGNVIFTQDAACPYSVPNPLDNNNVFGLWQSNFQHTCPFPLKSLTVQLSFGANGVKELYDSILYGLEGCTTNADKTAATCQVSPSARFISANGTVTPLGSLPLQEGANYPIWYTTQAHPCGSTNLAPLWITPIAATFDMPSPVRYQVARNTDIDNNNILLNGIPTTFDTEVIGTVSGTCYNEGTLRESGAACMTACDSWNGQAAQQPELQLPKCQAVVYVPANSPRSNVQTCCFLKSSSTPRAMAAPGIEAYKLI